MKPATEILLSAAFALTPEENWTQRALARDNKDQPVDPGVDAACKFCLVGALMSATNNNDLYESALHFVAHWGHAGAWNDTHTHDEVLDALYRAAELAEEA